MASTLTPPPVLTYIFGMPAADPVGGRLVEGLVATGVNVRLCELDPRASDDTNRARCSAAMVRDEPAVVGGFSLGARLFADVLGQGADPICGLVGFGFPFHRHGRPQEKHGLRALLKLHVPALIVQGARDSHGSRSEVRGYAVPASVRVVWIEGANHRLASGDGGVGDSLTQAMAHVVEFLSEVDGRK